MSMTRLYDIEEQADKDMYLDAVLDGTIKHTKDDNGLIFVDKDSYIGKKPTPPKPPKSGENITSHIEAMRIFNTQIADWTKKRIALMGEQ